MPRGTHLTSAEQLQIDTLKTAGWSNRRIASHLNRSKAAVDYHVRTPDHYQMFPKTGAPKKLSSRDKRGIIRKASNSMKSCNDIKKEMHLDVSKQTVWRVIDNDPNIVREVMRPAPHLTPAHKTRRLSFARSNMATDWTKMIFSDEKKFNLDGPDGYTG